MIYAIQAESGAIKFGRAKEPKRRMANLQVGNHEKLNLLAATETEGDEEIEKVVHEWLASYNLQGEWFKPGWRTSEVVEAIKSGELWSYIGLRSFSLWLWGKYRDQRAEKWLIANDDHFALLRCYQLLRQLSEINRNG